MGLRMSVESICQRNAQIARQRKKENRSQWWGQFSKSDQRFLRALKQKFPKSRLVDGFDGVSIILFDAGKKAFLVEDRIDELQ